jgi:hypothetical protein
MLFSTSIAVIIAAATTFIFLVIVAGIVSGLLWLLTNGILFSGFSYIATALCLITIVAIIFALAVILLVPPPVLG